MDPDIPDRFRAVDKALRWLDAQQNADGGFGTPTSAPKTTCDVVLAFGAAYEEPNTVQAGANSPLDYLATQAVTYTNTAEGAARLALAVVAGNEDPGNFRGSDVVTALEGYRQSSGQYAKDASDGIAAQALAIMALEASYGTVLVTATTWLKDQQNGDGGWGPFSKQPSDTQNTALSLQALVAAGESSGSQTIADGIAYLQARHTSDAGFADSASTSISDAKSTAFAIQALLAAGEDVLSAKWSKCLRTPFDALLSFQQGNGSVVSSVSQTPVMVPALMGRVFPLPGRGLAALRALEWLKTQQNSDGGFGNGGITADAVYAIARGGQDPDGLEWTENGNSALDALEDKTAEYIASAPGGHPAGELAKVIRAVHAAGGDPTDFPPGTDLVDELNDTYVETTGRYHPNKVFSHALALLALHDVGEAVPHKAATALENAQRGDGGWSWAWDGSTSDVDSTGRSMQALAASGGPSSPDVYSDAAGFLQDLQFTGGAFPDLASRSEPNCNSTALAIDGLLAAGRHRNEPLLFSTPAGGVRSTWDALLAFRMEDGSFAFTASSPESRLLATLDTIPALLSPWYPAYQPLSEGETTLAGDVAPQLTCGNGLRVVAPYLGDDDNDGSATLRYRVAGESSWNGPTSVYKGGLAYTELLHLATGMDYEIEITYEDPDGIEGENPQNFTIHMGKAYIPLAMSSHGS